MLDLNLFGRKKQRTQISVFGKTDVGCTREHNEDCFLVADLTAKKASLLPEVRDHEVGRKGSLLIVADGMGGAAAGEVASEMATEVVFEHLIGTWVDDDEDTPQQFAFRLRESVEEANRKIHAHAKANPEMRGMGTTMTAAGVLADHVYVTQVGDSRAYLIREGEATQLTKDQSLMQRLVDAGELTEEEAEKSERKNIILQALGPDARVKVDLTYQAICKGDAILLCSDGLSGLVTKEEIAHKQYDLHAGDAVSFDFEGCVYQGIIGRITKRATVFVKDPNGQFTDNEGKRYIKFYIPLQYLTRESN